MVAWSFGPGKTRSLPSSSGFPSSFLSFPLSLSSRSLFFPTSSPAERDDLPGARFRNRRRPSPGRPSRLSVTTCREHSRLKLILTIGARSDEDQDQETKKPSSARTLDGRCSSARMPAGRASMVVSLLDFHSRKGKFQ